jgi:hypothetical protein
MTHGHLTDGRSVLRVVLGIVGIAAVAISAEWARGVVEAFQPGFNEHGTPLAGDRLRIAVLGFLGILSALVAALSALAYARTAARKWVTRAVLSSLNDRHRVLPLVAVTSARPAATSESAASPAACIGSRLRSVRLKRNAPSRTAITLTATRHAVLGAIPASTASSASASSQEELPSWRARAQLRREGPPERREAEETRIGRHGEAFVRPLVLATWFRRAQSSSLGMGAFGMCR